MKTRPALGLFHSVLVKQQPSATLCCKYHLSFLGLFHSVLVKQQPSAALCCKHYLGFLLSMSSPVTVRDGVAGQAPRSIFRLVGPSPSGLPALGMYSSRSPMTPSLPVGTRGSVQPLPAKPLGSPSSPAVVAHSPSPPAASAPPRWPAARPWQHCAPQPPPEQLAYRPPPGSQSRTQIPVTGPPEFSQPRGGPVLTWKTNLWSPKGKGGGGEG